MSFSGAEPPCIDSCFRADLHDLCLPAASALGPLIPGAGGWVAAGCQPVSELTRPVQADQGAQNRLALLAAGPTCGIWTLALLFIVKCSSFCLHFSN